VTPPESLSWLCSGRIEEKTMRKLHIVARTPDYIVKQTEDPNENDGYPVAIYTREEAKYGKLAYPEWQCETVYHAIEWIVGAANRRLQVTCLPEVRDEVVQAQKIYPVIKIDGARG
jgi:hypothetical protein